MALVEELSLGVTFIDPTKEIRVLFLKETVGQEESRHLCSGEN